MGCLAGRGCAVWWLVADWDCAAHSHLPSVSSISLRFFVVDSPRANAQTCLGITRGIGCVL